MPIYKGSTNQGLIYYGSPNTNCLTSVPKNINLTYNAGVFTVHAGSIITVPYGGGTALNVGDKIGTVLEVVKVVGNYIQLKLLKDFSDTFGGSTSVLYMLTLGFNTNGNMYWSGTAVSANTSGSTDSSASISDGSLYFDTTNNIIYRRYGDGTTGYQFGGGINGVWISLPIACHYGTPTNAEQIFDWCGFIGSTAFVLPGVKGLIPNGFNADGTYRSIEFTTDSVLTTTRTWDITASFIQKLFIYNRGKAVGIQSYQIESDSMPTVNDWTVWYNPKENIQRWNNSSNTLTDISQWTVDTTMRYIGEIPSDGTSRIVSLVPTTVQPLSTGIQISNVYKGSQLVYKKLAGNINWSTDGTYTGVDIYNAQYTLTLNVRSASSDYTLAETHRAGTYSGTVTRGRQPRVNYWNMYCVLYYIDGTSETVWQETSCPEATATFTVNFVAKKPFNRVLWSLNYNPSDSVYCNGWFGPVGNWTLV